MLNIGKVKYLAVGATCAVVHNVVVIGCAQARIHYVFATFLSYVMVSLLGYVLHSAITFGEPIRVRGFIRYAAAMAMNYPLSVVLLFLLCDIAGLSIGVATPLSTGMLVVWNYIASRWAIKSRGLLSTLGGSQE